jgi:hypothetical protein
MKNTLLKTLALAASLFITGTMASASLIPQGLIPQGGNSNPSTEIAQIEANSTLEDLVYLARYDFSDNGGGSWSYGDPIFTGLFTATQYTGNPATSTVTWDLTGTGYTLEAVVTKTARESLNLYTVADDQKIKDLVGQDVNFPGKDSISHISFYGNRGTTNVPEGGASVALLGLALGGLGAARRFMVKKA